MRILIKPNRQKPEAARCAYEVAATLLEIAKRRGQAAQILLEEADSAVAQGFDAVIFGPYKTLLQDCDLVIPVGGDGTVMRAARDAAQAGKLILGVNAGHLGYLTQAEMNEVSRLERLFTGEYAVLNRMMLKARIHTGGEEHVHIALNDVVIRHGDADRIVAVEVKDAGSLIAAYRADGVIFSTPTGSTAYSLSAGGPVISPEMELVLLTPICPHSAFNCSIVLPAERVYTASEKPLGPGSGGLYVSLDGMRVCKLVDGGSVAVSRCEVPARFIDLGTREFFSNLNQKLSWR